jgi:hypothetical protein
MQSNDLTKKSSRPLKYSIILILIILTVQGWTGDFVNLFAVFQNGIVNQSLGGIITALESGGYLALFHAFEGLAVVILALIAVFLSFMKRKARLFTVLGTASAISAMIGGLLFVLSDFQNNAYSAQMGGSFIGAYAFFFLALYSVK